MASPLIAQHWEMQKWYVVVDLERPLVAKISNYYGSHGKWSVVTTQGEQRVDTKKNTQKSLTWGVEVLCGLASMETKGLDKSKACREHRQSPRGHSMPASPSILQDRGEFYINILLWNAQIRQYFVFTNVPGHKRFMFVRARQVGVLGVIWLVIYLDSS